MPRYSTSRHVRPHRTSYTARFPTPNFFANSGAVRSERRISRTIAGVNFAKGRRGLASIACTDAADLVTHFKFTTRLSCKS